MLINAVKTRKIKHTQRDKRVFCFRNQEADGGGVINIFMYLRGQNHLLVSR